VFEIERNIRKPRWISWL